MDNNFKFKTRHVSIVQRSSSVVNSFASSVELIQAMTCKVNNSLAQKVVYKFSMHLRRLLYPMENNSEDWGVILFLFYIVV